MGVSDGASGNGDFLRSSCTGLPVGLRMLRTVGVSARSARSPGQPGKWKVPSMSESTIRRRRKVKLTSAIGLAVAGVVGGAALATSLSANAATSPSASSSVSSSSTTSGSSSGSSRPSMPQHGTAAHEDQEKAVTGTDATKAQAAAVKSVGSGTAGSVTTNFTGDGYEVTVTKSDGSSVEVHLDSSFNVMDHGGPGGAGGGPQGAPGGAAPQA